MIFNYAVTIPKNTTKAAPVDTLLQLTRGTIVNMELQFPSGVIALAHVQLYVGGHQLYPSNPDGDFATSNETIDWPVELDLDTGANQLRFIGWNTDASFDHTITVRVVMRDIKQPRSIASEVAALLATNQVGA